MGTVPGLLIAAAAYSAVVFIAGFILGTLRVLALAPRFGDIAAVALEIPVMLAFSWFASRAVCRRFAVPALLSPRVFLGGAAFALLIIAEVALSVWAFGLTVRGWAGSLGTPAGLLGLAGQVGFGAVPAIQAALRRET